MSSLDERQVQRCPYLSPGHQEDKVIPMARITKENTPYIILCCGSLLFHIKHLHLKTQETRFYYSLSPSILVGSNKTGWVVRTLFITQSQGKGSGDFVGLITVLTYGRKIAFTQPGQPHPEKPHLKLGRFTA